MIKVRELQLLTAAINRDGPTEALLKRAVLLLADQIIDLQREIDRVNALASRAERQSRIGGMRIVR